MRHFLIECTSKGVRLKGCPNEPYFGEIPAGLVFKLAPLCLPLLVRTAQCSHVCVFWFLSGSLTALVCQHSITPLALPCKLILPDRGERFSLFLFIDLRCVGMTWRFYLFVPTDPLEELNDTSTQTATNSAAELLKQGAGSPIYLFLYFQT